MCLLSLVDVVAHVSHLASLSFLSLCFVPDTLVALPHLPVRACCLIFERTLALSRLCLLCFTLPNALLATLLRGVFCVADLAAFKALSAFSLPAVPCAVAPSPPHLVLQSIFTASFVSPALAFDNTIFISLLCLSSQSSPSTVPPLPLLFLLCLHPTASMAQLYNPAGNPLATCMMQLSSAACTPVNPRLAEKLAAIMADPHLASMYHLALSFITQSSLACSPSGSTNKKIAAGSTNNKIAVVHKAIDQSNIFPLTGTSLTGNIPPALL